jgi:hypothetical protein
MGPNVHFTSRFPPVTHRTETEKGTHLRSNSAAYLLVPKIVPIACVIPYHKRSPHDLLETPKTSSRSQKCLHHVTQYQTR